MTPELLAKDDGLYLRLTDDAGREALLLLKSNALIAAAVIDATWEKLRAVPRPGTPA